MGRFMCVLALCLVTSTGCITTKAEGDQMREEIEALKAEQDTFRDALNKREQNMAVMIKQARQEINNLERLISKAEEALRRNDAEAGVDMQKTREEITRLRNAVDEMQQRVGTFEEKFKIVREDVDFRLASIVKQQNSLPENASELLSLAQKRLAGGEVRPAREAFEAFIKRHGEDARVDQAIYGVAETYHKESKHRTAIFEYQKILKTYPKSRKAAHATLRIGQGLKTLGLCAKAKLFFETVVADYKRSPAVGVAQTELKNLSKAKCK